MKSNPNNTWITYSHSHKAFFAVFVIPEVLTLVMRTGIASKKQGTVKTHKNI